MIMKTSLKKKKKKGQVKNNITMLAGFSLFFGLNFLRSRQKKKKKYCAAKTLNWRLVSILSTAINSTTH